MKYLELSGWCKKVDEVWHWTLNWWIVNLPMAATLPYLEVKWKKKPVDKDYFDVSKYYIPDIESCEWFSMRANNI